MSVAVGIPIHLFKGKGRVISCLSNRNSRKILPEVILFNTNNNINNNFLVRLQAPSRPGCENNSSKNG